MNKAIYPGTFDPITNGHLDVIQRSAMMFDEIVVSVTDDNNKNTLFSIEERVNMIKKSIQPFDNVKVSTFNGLLVDHVQKESSNVIIRGLRVLSDFEYEFKIALMNRNLNSQINTIFLMPHEKYIHVSSSLIKEVASLGGDISSYVPSCIIDEVIDKIDA